MINLTTIQLVTSGGTELGYLDLDDNTIVPITYSIGDIRDISKKNGSFSKSITIKGSKLNNILFNNYYDVNIIGDSTTFDINRTQFCRVLQNGVVVIDNAVLQLVSVTKQQDGNNYDEQIQYTCLVKDTAADFFTTINEKLLENLDLGLSTHVFNASNVINSFNNTVTDGYKYMMCFNPENGTDSAYTQTYPIFELEEFKPAIYAKTYFDSIFNNTNYRYKWNSLSADTIQFDKLLIPYNGDSIITDNINDQYTVKVDNSNTGSQSIKSVILSKHKFLQPVEHPVIDSVKTLINVTNETLDPSNSYAASYSAYISPNLPSNNNYVNYNYQISYKINVVNPNAYQVHYAPLDMNNGNGFQIKGDCEVDANLMITNVTTKADKAFPAISYVIKKGDVFNNGTTNLITNTIAGSIDIQPIDPNVQLQLNAILHLQMINSTYGDSHKVFTKDNATSENNVYVELVITSVNLTINSKINGTYGYGSTIDFFVPKTTITGSTYYNPFAPKTIKQSDFIKSIFTMFNLYCETDKDDSLLLNIYRRDDYYDSGTTKDWTTKIAKDNSQELIFLPELKNKKILLTYKEDSDFANKSYQDNVNEIYGQQIFTFDNEYVRDIDTHTLLFSPTPMTNLTFGAVVPMLDGTAPKCNIRILHDGGQTICRPFFIENYKYSGTSYGDTSLFFNQMPAGSTGVFDLGYSMAANFYPFISHQNDPVNPTYDINFGQCDYYFRTDDWNNTNNNLFNNHWLRTLNNINVGKMLTANFVLNENDINNMRLNDRILVNNSWWNINQIIDYNANSNDATKVELISIDEFIQKPFDFRTAKPLSDYSPQINQITFDLSRARSLFTNFISNGANVSVGGGTGNLILNPIRTGSILGSNNIIGGYFPSFVLGNANTLNNGGSVSGDNNFIQDSGNFVWGNHNTLTGTNTTGNYIWGNTNSIASGSTGTFVLGSNNSILNDINGSFVLGNNITVTGENTTYVNNLNIQSGGTLTIGDTIFDQHTFQLNSASLSTGLYEFGSNGITIASPTTFNIGNVKGWIVDSNDVLDANPTFIQYSGATNLTTPYINNAPATYFMIDSGSTLVLINTRPTLEQRRNYIYLGAIGHPNGIINVAANDPDIIMNEMSQVRAMFEPIRLINDKVFPYANGTDLKLANTAGRLFGFGIGFIPNGNIGATAINILAGAPTTFQYRTQTSGFGTSTNFIDPTQWDNNGNNVTIGNPSKQATNQRIYLLEDGEIRIQLGQTVYGTLSTAISAVQSEPFITFPNNANLGILIGILSITKQCTNLSDNNNAQFIPVSKFGEALAGSGGGGVSVATLQSTYNNSSNPEIVTNNGLGGLSIQRGSAADTDNVLSILNGAAAQTSAIDGNGNVFATSFIKTGGNSSQFLMADGSISTLSSFNEITGIGTTNLIAKWNSAFGLTNSQIFDNGNDVIVNNTTTGTTRLIVNKFNQLSNSASPTGALVLTNTGSNTIGLDLGVSQFSLSYIQSRSTINNINKNILTLNPDGGNILIGTNTDNTIDKLQVNGSANILTNLNVGSAFSATSSLIKGSSIINGDSGGTQTYLQFKNGTNLIGQIGSDTSIFSINPNDIGLMAVGANDVYLANNSSKRLVVKGGGNVLIGTTADNVVDKLQINGSLIATSIKKLSAIAGGGQTLFADGNNSVGYKVYTALLTQTGIVAPVATILENTIGTISWSRNSTGVYAATSSGLFTTNKTICFITNGNAPTIGVFEMYQSNTNTVILNSINMSSINTDVILTQATIEIRVYN